MTGIPDRFHLSTAPLAPDSAIVQGDNHRITVLTPQLVRIEWSPSGSFTDQPTQTVLNRDFPPCDFTVTDEDSRLQIITEHLHLSYNKQYPSRDGLSVTGKGNYHSVWRYTEEPNSKFADYLGVPTNLKGTARTLDVADGAIDLENGLVSTLGIASLDDSKCLPLDDDSWPIPREEGAVDLYVFAHGTNFAQALADFHHLSGPQPMLPRYALGNWWSRYYPYTQDGYIELMNRFAEEDLPFSVAVLDMDWHQTDIDPKYGHGWTGYTWNTDLFPDHVRLLEWLHDRGLRVTLNVHPADGVRGSEQRYPEMVEAMGIDPDSDLPVSFDIADKRFAMNYFAKIHHPLEDEGVDFWWVDWQQGSSSSIPGLDPLWMLNHLHYLDSSRGGERSMTFSRYAGPGSHRYPIGFSGDTIISWESLDFQPYFTATASNIGYGWWSHDIGGHMFGYRNDELATRWVQFGCFSPINRLHSGDNAFSGKEPWQFNEIAERVQGEYLRFRHRLVPYLYTMNERAHSAATPLILPMYYHPARTEASLGVPNQYLFGSELLVAPITSPQDPHLNRAKVSAWLPPGTWIDIFTGLIYDGDRSTVLYRGLGDIPVLAAAGGILPLTGPDQLRVENPAALEVRLYAGADGEFLLYEDDDAAEPRAVRTRFRFDWRAGIFSIDGAEGELDVVPAARHYTVVLVGAREAQVERFATNYDPVTNSLFIDVGEVSTAEGATVTFSSELVLHDNAVEQRVFDLLDQAEISFELKQDVMDVLERNSTAARRMSALMSMRLDDDLLGALSELLLAHPNEK